MDFNFKYATPLSKEFQSQYRFRRQWVLLKIDDKFQFNWVTHKMNGGMVLYTHPDTRVAKISDEENNCGIIILGLAVDSQDLERNAIDRFCIVDSTNHQNVVKNLNYLTGTYTVIRYYNDEIYFYTDPAAMMGVYYSDQRVASSPSLIPESIRDNRMNDKFPFGKPDDWYPGSLCPFGNIKSLLANHCLDFKNKTIKRYWPIHEFEKVSSKDGIEQISSIFNVSMNNLNKIGHILCSLTGGKDSRVNLSAVKNIREQIEFFTIVSDKMNSDDYNLPKRMKESFEINHQFVPFIKAETWLFDLYDEIGAGMAIGSRREIIGACKEIAGSNYIHLNGNLGALAKSFYWPSKNPKSIDEYVLVKEFVNRPPQILNAIHEWFSSIGDLPPAIVYNLLYLEQRAGKWMGPGENCSNLFYESFTPFNNRIIFEIISGMPLDFQYGGKILVSLVEEMWPELLKIPYCRNTRNWSKFIPVRIKNYVKHFIQ